MSRKLPMWTIYDLVGLPDELRDEIADAADSGVSWSDEESRGGLSPMDFLQKAITVMITTGVGLAASRRANPTDDLMSSIVEAEVDGQRLTDAECGAFMVLVSVAGNDTTRNTTSLAMQALSRYPDQREYLCADLPNRIGPAVEELVRWATPVQTFRRTATRDTQLRDQIIRAGEKVVMFYGSANRDDRVFEEPRRFNVARSPNPHLGFGGGGTHFCLGASLARTQLRALFEQLLSRVHGLEVGEPHRLVSNFVNNVHSMPYHY